VIRHLLEWVHRLLAPSYVEVGPGIPLKSFRAKLGLQRVPPPKTVRHKPHVPRVCTEHPPTEHPLPGTGFTGTVTRVKFDASRTYETTVDGLLLQRAAVDVLLADGRMSRIGVLAAYDALPPHEPRRISYIPIHEMVPSTEIVP